MGSTRLPGKVMLDLCGKPVIWHVIDRLRRSKMINNIVVATTDLPEDTQIYEVVRSWGVNVFRGSSDNVLSRYYHAAKAYPCDTVIRVTSDCPLIDPGICDKIISFYHSHTYLYVSNSGADMKNRTYPRGLDCEVFSFDLLEEARNNATEPYEREHVTPYMYWKNESVHYYKNEVDYSHLRWTLDTPEDYELISYIYKILYDEDKLFTWQDVLAAYTLHPDWHDLNEMIKQKDIFTK